MHLYKSEIWQDGAGHWHVADTHDLAHDSSIWVHPARLLDMTGAEFAKYLIDTWKVDHIHYFIKDEYKHDPKHCGLLYFYWNDYNQAHKYQLYINKIARHKNWTIQYILTFVSVV